MKYGCARMMSGIRPKQKTHLPFDFKFQASARGRHFYRGKSSRMGNKAIEKLILMERLSEVNGHRLPIVDKKDKDLNKTLKNLFCISLLPSRVPGTQCVFNKYL